MTEYFAGYEVVARTRNFLVTCVNDEGARQRANNVAATCEYDLSQLNDLFNTRFEAGTTSPYAIWVVVLEDDPTSNISAWNQGYETEQSSTIYIQRGYYPPPPSPPSLIPPDPPPLTGVDLDYAVTEVPRFLFVAELAEIMMEYSGYGWYPGNSSGEGLSNVLGALLHPSGYYDLPNSNLGGPRVNAWMNGTDGPPKIAPFTDYVTGPDNTDKNQASYGCAILFINWLVYQLGYPLKDVIRTGGSSLSETYARLTGKPAGTAFSAFWDLLRAHVNAATTVQRDNIFPLFDLPYRGITITEAAPIVKLQQTDAKPASFTVKPGPLCAAQPFDFFETQQLIEQPVYARSHGLANAVFRWVVADVEVPIRQAWTTVEIDRPVTKENPDNTITSVGDTMVLQYGIQDFWNGSALYLKTISWQGNCVLPVTVSAHEAATPGEAEVSHEANVALSTVSWSPGTKLQNAWKRCNPFFARMNDSFWYLTSQLSDVQTRPDPPPVERTTRSIVDAVTQLQKEVELYARASRLPEAEVWRLLWSQAGFRSAQPVQTAIDLTRRLVQRSAIGDDGARKDADPTS